LGILIWAAKKSSRSPCPIGSPEGFNCLTPEFVAGRVLVLSGAEHKSDKLKFWADEASLQEQ